MTIGVTLALGAVIGVLLGLLGVAGQSSPFLRWSTCWVWALSMPFRYR